MLDGELQNGLGIGAGKLAGIVGPENFFRDQSLGGDAVGKNEIDVASLTFFRSQAHAKLPFLEQANEATSEAQEVGGTHDEGFQEAIQVADGAQFGGDFKQLVKFVSLIAGGGIEFGVGDGDGAEACHRRDQRSFIVGENAIGARVDKNRALRAGSPEGRSEEHSGGHEVAERMGGRVDRYGDRLSGGNGSASDVGGEPKGGSIVASAG